MLSPVSPDLSRIAVIGAGTMGSGIALAALLADFKVALYDVDPAVLERARLYIETGLARKQRSINRKYLHLTHSLEELGKPGLILEAIPEDLSLKQDLFRQLDRLYPEPVFIATNTSSLPVTAIASATQSPQRVGGMHFFNPAPVMPLVEVVRGAFTSEGTIHSLSAAARRMGKTPIVARDTPGFIVNRVARPFYGEALRIYGEGAASPEQIDRLAREGAGFRMGPFQLMDLIGLDVNLAATRSVWEQSFYEPRFRPHLIQAQMVQAGRLGRKTGRGFYTYDGSGKPLDLAPRKPSPPPPADPARPISITISPGNFAPGLAEACRRAGYTLEDWPPPARRADLGFAVEGASGGLARCLVELDQVLPPQAPLFCQCADVTLAEALSWVKNPPRVVGFDGLFFASGAVVTLVAGPHTSAEILRQAESLCASLGKAVEWIVDSPGLVLPRILCMLANEAAFALGENVAPADVIDQAMQLGANYPKGPLSWAGELGYRNVVSVLDALQKEFGEDRYRAAPLLRRFARLEKLKINE